MFALAPAAVISAAGPGPARPARGVAASRRSPISSSCASLLRESSSLGVGTAPARAPRAGAFARLAPLTPPRAPTRASRVALRDPRVHAVTEPSVHAAKSTSSEASSLPEEEARDFALQADELEHLRPLRDAILAAGGDLAAKSAAVDADPRVARFVAAAGPVARILPNISFEDAYLIKCVVAAGQEAVLVPESEDPLHVANALAPLCSTLRHVENFYDMLGGVVGYQFAAVELVHEAFGGPPATVAGGLTSDASADASPGATAETSMHVPVGPDLREGGGEYARQAAAWGLEELPRMAEVYPLGGAGDRLGLQDEVTGESLPAALLNYNGRTLIEGLLRDLTAREWLYYKVNGTQHVTPVAVMTSAAKGNHGRISKLMEDNAWFGRGKEAFRLFEQPLVPVVTTRGGAWVPDKEGELAIALKPGGHGAIWKLMHDRGVFTWLAAKGRKGATVRQITNPMAGTDTTILALSGVGAKEDRAMGFASCERHLGASEGVNVLMERRDARGNYSYGISNVEYTVLAQHGISDEPVAPGSTESRYPANTNVLYIGLEKVRDALLSSPAGAFPGMLVNLSKPVTDDGTKGGRLETSMQNIADVLSRVSEGERLDESEWGNLPTFVLYTLRRRITSSAKKKRDPSKANLAQTPDGSFLDLLKNASDLLDRCGVKHPAPEGGTVEQYLAEGPGFIFCADPAIGPLWDVTEQKIRGGALADRAEVRLEVAEMQWENVSVSGSLLVEAKAPLGADAGSALKFDDHACGRCRLRNVVVTNEGVDWTAEGNVAWSATLTRRERCQITIEGNGEFDAKGVKLRGDAEYVVPAGWRLELRPFGPRRQGIEQRWTRLDAAGGRPTWQWQYAIGEGGRVVCTLVEREVASHGKTREEAEKTATKLLEARTRPGESDGFKNVKGSIGSSERSRATTAKRAESKSR